MIEIKLERGVWRLDDADRLGPAGGFGEVFRGQGPEGEVAIKRLKLTASAAAHREMKIGKDLAGRTLEHVVPVLDYGQDADTDRYYLVMPVCEYSLQDYLQRKGILTWEEAKPIALNIVAGLTEVGDIVHRDLKPGNVLWKDGRWQIADFGIAKFVEDSTSLETLRDSLTAAYGAPEQWLMEKPTRATDVYALGCILHAMINGGPPFKGDFDQIRDGHLRKDPPELEGVPARLNSLVTHMLRKTAPSRPAVDRCGTVFSTLESTSTRPVHDALAEAGRQVAKREAEEESKRREEEASRRARETMGQEAVKDLKRSMNRLYHDLEAASESVKRDGNDVRLGRAHLSYLDPTLQEMGRLRPADPFEGGWDVMAHSIIAVQGPTERYSPRDRDTYTFSASLIYASIERGGEYRWRELSFWAFGGEQDSPFAIVPNDDSFRQAMSHVIGGVNIAHGPWTIDAEDEEAFHDRWKSFFARAASGKLTRPMQMPPPRSFFE